METFIPRGRITGPILPSFVLRENISPGAKMLYALLCNHASDKDHCWPSHRFLAQELGYCVSSIKNWLGELVRARLLAIRPHETGGTSVSCVPQDTFLFLLRIFPLPPPSRSGGRQTLTTPRQTLATEIILGKI